jgi:hypothetical protein
MKTSRVFSVLAFAAVVVSSQGSRADEGRAAVDVPPGENCFWFVKGGDYLTCRGCCEDMWSRVNPYDKAQCTRECQKLRKKDGKGALQASELER